MKKWTNQYKRSRNNYPSDHVGGPLDNNQKARICILAREAFLKAQPNGVLRNLRDWRQEETFKAVGKLSLCDCVEADYKPLCAHFEDRAGESGRALETLMKAQLEPAAIARYHLIESCAERGLQLSYAEKICKNEWKRDLDDPKLSARQIWCVVFTVRTRRKPLPEYRPISANCPF